MDREPEERSFARPRMSGHASRGHEGRMQRPVSLSVFNSPTATYMWPGFQAASQMDHPPVIYVNYEREPTRSASNSVSSQQDSPIILPHPLSRHDRSVSTLLPRKRRSSSPAGRALPAESSSVVKILEPLRRVHLVETPARSLPSMKHQQGDCTASPPRESPQSSSEHGRQPSPSVPYTYRHESSPSTSDASDPSSSVPPTIHRASPKGDPEEWEQYARPTTSPDGTSRKWLCTWVTVDSDKRINCCYMSKKQLVKRHVETTHLRYKPFVCEVCGKGFPQKTSLDTHMHGHTGSTPHECRYGCGMSFKDPARRHRHMVDEHGYVPRQSKKKHKSGQPPQDPSDFESLRPWNA
ncbi:hypothetical protein BV22DRAFT_1125705 [Leucogyrophana mollusca]|uniref:Uncharacterized protein n=1 Tax=Leucogyrophana mollusca TaxID=85980 RepID=A0ACB8BWB2_9AGAM|nr:hypothetical protein BV22DRAFT_1125705 [Leucogyrophana mollusca]